MTGRMDWRKELSSPPLKQNGFTDELRKKIERRLDEPPARNRVPIYMTAGAYAAVVVAALFFLVQWLRPGEELRENTLSSASGADPINAQLWETSVDPSSFRSALLIGLRSDSPDGGAEGKEEPRHLPEYRTLLIAPDPDHGIRVAAAGSGLLVPYGQVFWKIDALSGESGDDRYQIVAAGPADAGYAPPIYRDITEESVYWTETVLFAGNRYVSLAETLQVRDDGGRLTERSVRLQVRELEQLAALDHRPSPPKAAKHVTLDDIFGENAARSGELLLGEEARDGSRPQLNAVEWGIVRSQGRWAAVVLAPGSDGEAAHNLRHAVTPLTLPESVVSHDTLAIPWAEIEQTLPGAQDALTSPTGDYAAVVIGNRLGIYPLADGRIGKTSLLDVELAPEESLVMAQWATDDYVPIWVKSAQKYLQQQ